MTRCVRGHYRRAAQQVTISFMNPSLSPFRPLDARACLLSLNASSVSSLPPTPFSFSFDFFSIPSSLSLSLLSLSVSLSFILGSRARAKDATTMSGRWSLRKREKDWRIIGNLNDRLFVTTWLYQCWVSTVMFYSSWKKGTGIWSLILIWFNESDIKWAFFSQRVRIKRIVFLILLFSKYWRYFRTIDKF